MRDFVNKGVNHLSKGIRTLSSRARELIRNAPHRVIGLFTSAMRRGGKETKNYREGIKGLAGELKDGLGGAFSTLKGLFAGGLLGAADELAAFGLAIKSADVEKEMIKIQRPEVWHGQN